MKIIGKVFRFIIYTILTILVIINLVIFVKSVFFPKQVPSIFGYKPFVVMSNSMNDEFKKGDLIFSKVVDYDELEEGDVISFRNDKDFVTTHRIYEVTEKNGSICFITKGDNNNKEDKGLVCSDSYEGKYVGKIEDLGNIILFIKEPWGFISMMSIIITICLIIYFTSGERESLDKEELFLDNEEE
jgi:signal peptidase